MLSYFQEVVHTNIKRVLCAFGPSNVKIGRDCFLHLDSVYAATKGRIRIGKACKIHKGAILASYGGEIILKDNVSINPYSVLYGNGGLYIGAGTRIAAHVMIVADQHNYTDMDVPIYKQGCRSEGITIEDDVWIGAGAKILDGAYIAKGCVIGANSVVKGKTEQYGIYVGTPAKKIGMRISKAEPTPP